MKINHLGDIVYYVAYLDQLLFTAKHNEIMMVLGYIVQS